MSRHLFLTINLILIGVSLGATEKQNPTRRAELQGRVQLEMDEQIGASKYEIELQDSKRKKPPLLFSAKTPRFDIRVPVGKYLLRGRVLDRRKLESPWSPPEVVKVPPTVQMKVPSPVLFPTQPDSPHEIRWQPSADVTVIVKLEHQKLMANEWKVIEKVEKVEGSSWKSNAELEAGRYRWTIFFEDEVFGKSEPNTSTFLVKPRVEDLDPKLRPVLKSLGI